MIKLKKMGIWMVAAAVAAWTLGGCSPKSDSSAEEDGVLELEFYNKDGKADLWNNPVAEKLTEATGVRLKIDYPVSAEDYKVALMIAEQNFPDMIYAKGDAASLIDAGALIDLAPLIEEYGPNIKKMYGDEFDKLRFSVDDPSIYQLSSYAVGGEFYSTSGTAQLQWAVLKEQNYEIPRTIAQLEASIKAYMKNHPTTEDGLPTVGLSLSASDWHWMITLGNPAGFIANGSPDNGQWIIDENNQARYKFRTEEEREYFRWLNRMYQEGVLDPEFATQTHEDYLAKISSGRVLALLDQDWDYRDAERVLKSDGKLDKTYAPLPVAMDETIKCPSLMYQGLVTGQGVGITTGCKDPVAAVKYLDYICSDEGQVLVNWGVEGINYEVDENGKRYRTREEIEYSQSDKDYSKKTGVGAYNYPFPTYGNGVTDASGSTYTPTSKESVIAEYDEEQQAACEAWGVELLTDIFPQPEEFEVPKYPPVWAYTKSDEFDDIGNKLDEIAWSGLVSCVICAPEEFDAKYDEMIGKFENAGMLKAEAMLTEIIQSKVALVE